jgi:hypothetical protein
MNIEQIILRKLEEIREYEWTPDNSLKIWGNYIKDGESLLEAIARNLAEAVEKEQ